MADGRRVITGTYVIAKEGNDTEGPPITTKYIIDSTVGKTLGGKSIVTTSNGQWAVSAWYVESTVAGQNLLSLGSTASPVKFLYIKNLDTTTHLNVSLGVEQIWNTGWSAANNWEDSTYTDRPPSYDGWWDEGCHITIPPKGSIQLRGDGTNFLITEVFVRTNNKEIVSQNIEYVIAN